MDRRLMRVGITPEVLVQSMLTTGHKRSYRIIGAPEGTEIIRCGYDRERDLLYVLLRHESFEPVPEGEIVPILNIRVEVE